MWRIGFKFWRVWVWARVALPALLLLWAVHHVYGMGPEFRSTLLFLGGVILGAAFVLTDLYRRELGGTLGRNRR